MERSGNGQVNVSGITPWVVMPKPHWKYGNDKTAKVCDRCGTNYRTVRAENANVCRDCEHDTFFIDKVKEAENARRGDTADVGSDVA